MKQHNGLCISGGSFKGISALGALFYMEEKEQLKNIKYYAGTSIGGIIITLLCCGIKPFEIFSYIYTEKNLLNIFLGVNNLIDYFSTNMEDIIKGIGLYKIYDTFSYKIEEFILQKTGWEKIPTLKELYEKTNKHLYLVTTKEDEYGQFSKVILSHLTTPNLSILRACEMTANIPLLFIKILEEKSHYIDGCFSDDFPYESLKEFIIKDKTSPNILSILLIEDKTFEKKYNPIIYLYRLLSYPSQLRSYDQIKRMNKQELKNFIELKLPIENPVNFNITNALKMEYFMIGYNACEKKMEKIEKE